MAIATLVQVNVESTALKGGASERDALAKGLSAAFWFCGACAATGEHPESLPEFVADMTGVLVILFGMRGWQMLSEMKQGGESRYEMSNLPDNSRTDTTA